MNNDKLFLDLLLGIGCLLSIVFPWNNYVENSIELRWYIPVFCMGLAILVLVKQNDKVGDNFGADIFRYFIWKVFKSDSREGNYFTGNRKI